MPDDLTYGAGTAIEDESDAEARESRGEFVGKYTMDRLYKLQSELKGMQDQPMTPEAATKLQEFNQLLFRVHQQKQKYPGRPGPLTEQSGTTQEKKGDKSNVPAKLGGPEDEDDPPLQEVAKDLGAVPLAAFHALAMRPYNAAKTLASPEGQYQPSGGGTVAPGDEEGVKLGNTAAGAVGTGALRAGAGMGGELGAMGARIVRRTDAQKLIEHMHAKGKTPTEIADSLNERFAPLLDEGESVSQASVWHQIQRLKNRGTELGAFGGKPGKGVPVENMQAATQELQKITEAIQAATQHLNALGAKKATGGFGRAEYESAMKIQEELQSLMKRGQALQLKITKAKSGPGQHTMQPRAYGYDPAKKKPGAHAGGLPAPADQTFEQFQAEGNL